MLKIDKRLPIASRDKYRMTEMEIGDSIFIAERKADHRRLMCKLHGVATYRGVKIECHSTTENELEGVRFWRVV